MNATALIGFLLLSAVEPRPPEAARRYAVLIGANAGDRHETRLRYAESDALKVGETLRTVGDFPPDQVLLLTGVTADDARAALIRLNSRLRQQGAETLLFVFYSGHADRDNLHLAGTHLPVDELRALVGGSPASTRILVVDACRAGTVTRVKGGSPTAPFAVALDEGAPPTGLAILTSSAESEDSQESDLLRGSFFTHYLNTGLIGAADQNRDGGVTLGEAFSFAAQQTTAATWNTAAGPQHPTYRYELGGRRDLVLTRPRTQRHNLGRLAFGQPGRYAVRKVDPVFGPVTTAEVAASTAGTHVAVAPGTYEVLLRRADHVYQTEYRVADGAVVEVAVTDMRRADFARMVRKGEAASATSVYAQAGGHGPWLGFGLGAAGSLGLRHDRRRFALEARLGGELSEGGEQWTNVDGRNTVTTASVLALVPWDFGPLSVSVGLEVGALRVRQTFDAYGANALPAQQLRGGTGYGAVMAPVLQLEVPVLRRAYVRLEAASPVHLLRAGTYDWSAESRMVVQGRLLAGFGVYL